MKIKFRHHRGSLAEAIKTLREFNSEEEMKEHIMESWKGWFTKEDIVIGEDHGPDTRINWPNSHYVCTKRFGDKINEPPQCIGMCCIEE